MKVLVETSARHLHLSQEHLEILFGAGHELTVKKMLSQPGQFACEEKVEVKVTQEQKIPFSKSIKALTSNIYFWATLGLWTVTCVHATIVGTDLPYYCKYILHNDDWMYSVLFTAEIIVMILGAMIHSF